MVSDTSILRARAFSIDNMASEDSWSSRIVDLTYVLINCNFEKLRSPLATVTGRVRRILIDIHVFWEVVAEIIICNELKYIPWIIAVLR